VDEEQRRFGHVGLRDLNSAWIVTRFEAIIGKRLNIRNARVIAKVREQAALRGMTMTDLIALAVERLEPTPKPMISEAEKAARLAELKAMIDADHSRLRPGFTTSMDEFYDPDSGLPI
jgi:hypothetical protein